MLEISEVLSALARQRPVFHSEADFRHALAFEIHRRLPGARIRLEVPVNWGDGTLRVDVWVVYQDAALAIELKYLTARLSVQVEREGGSEQYRLKEQSAHDLGRYDFIRDIQRLERVTAAHQRAYRSVTGYAILLTNDPVYWKGPRQKGRRQEEASDAAFRLHEGRVLEGCLSWGRRASRGTMKGREEPLKLRAKYVLEWSDYSQVGLGEGREEFRALVVKVVPPEKEDETAAPARGAD